MGAAVASWKKDISIKNNRKKTFPFRIQYAHLFVWCYQTSLKTRSAKGKQAISQTKINTTAVISYNVPLKPLKCKSCFISGCCNYYAPLSCSYVQSYSQLKDKVRLNLYIILSWPSVWDALQLKKLAI